MKNKILLIMMIAVSGIIFGSATDTFAQMPPVVGGYSRTDAAAAEVVAATNFAVKAQMKKQRDKIKLVAVNNAARQVVAGMNYQMCLNVETTDRQTKKTAPQTVQTVVFKNLKGKYSLTSWAVAACTDVAPTAPVQ